MPSLTLPRLFLCVDGGGTSVKVVIAAEDGRPLGRGASGPCNVKSVGASRAIDVILQATYQALASLDEQISISTRAAELSKTPHPPPFDRRVFSKVWLGLAGILHQPDIDAFAPYARKAFHISDDESDDALRITNDGHLLASPCTLMPHIESTVVLVAGTGTVGLAFKKRGAELDLVGVSGGWGYLLGDEGSAYSIGRLAIRYILEDDDARKSLSLSSPTSAPTTSLLPLVIVLLKYFGIPDASALVEKTYSDHSTPSSPSFLAAETRRKVWIAEAARLVFAFAFDSDVDLASRTAALSIVTSAVEPLVTLAARLVADRSVIVPEKASLSLGGGLWKVQGYCDLLRRGLKEAGIDFAEVMFVGDAPEEGARALVAQAKAGVAEKGAGDVML